MAVGGNVKKNKKAKTDLPEEIIREEILTRLPIKSVVRFKSVCKPWLSLFSDPIFVKDHLTRNSTQNPNDYDCLVAYKNTRIVILSRYKETLVLPSDDYVLVGSVQGLVCVCRGDKLSLWNPAIHQSKEFTLPSQRYGHLNYIGIGFHHASNDYKVVVCCLSDGLWYSSVYSVDSDAWSNVFTPDNVFPKTNRKEWHAPKTMVKDCPYWTCPTYTNNRFSVSSLAVVKFDVESNEFKLLPKFYFVASGQGWPRRNDYELVSLKDCLTLMVYERSKTSIVDVYSLHEEGCHVWSKIYSVGPLDLYTHYPHLSQGFRYGGEIVCHNHGKFFCYDQKTGTIKRLFGTTSHMNLLSCFTYVPSLVYLQGMKSVHVQTQTRMSSNCFRTPRRLMNSLRH